MADWSDWRPDVTITDLGGGDVEISWDAAPPGDLATLDGSPGYFIELYKFPFSGGDYDSYIGSGTPADPTCPTINIPSGGFDDCDGLSAVFHSVPYGTHFHFFLEANGDGATLTSGDPTGGAWSSGDIDLGVIAMGDSRTVDGNAGPDFSLTPATALLAFSHAGHPTPQQVDIATATGNGDTESISFSHTAMPPGLSGGFSPSYVSAVGGSISFVVTRTGAQTNGTYTVTVTGTGDTTGNTHDVTVTIVVGPIPVLQKRFPTV